MSMYANKLVATVKVAGKVLREQDDRVFLPWNSEYSIFVKNLHTQRAVVNIEVDGENVTGGGLIVEENNSIDLERFLDGNMTKGRKFKFIKRTSDIEDHRGVKAEDGLIRISFQYEKVIKPYYPPYRPYDDQPWVWVNSWQDREYYGSGFRSGDEVQLQTCVTTSSALYSQPGITVKGSKSCQEFKYGYAGALEVESHSMVIQLVGIDDARPITVNRKKHCPSCGREYKFNNEYCSKDGTYLELRPR